MGDTGFESSRLSKQKSAILVRGDVNSDVTGGDAANLADVDDPSLSRLIDLWPSLPDDVRLQILALAEAGETSAR